MFSSQTLTLKEPVSNETLENFKKIILHYMFFHIFFWALLLVEILIFFTITTTLIASSLLSIGLSTLVFTFFLYLILHPFFLQRKAEMILELKEDTEEALKRSLKFKEEDLQHHILLANDYCSIEQKMGLERDKIPKKLKTFYLFFLGKDLFTFREALLKASLKEHIKLVRMEPKSLEMHAALANAYVRLSSLYSNTLNLANQEEEGLPFGLDEENLKSKFELVSKKAIEEFNILNDYAPNEPWVHEQLAMSFRDLKRPKEEMREYETILNLKPDDLETSFKLGTLYFQEGEAAKGLRIYERLKRFHPKYAERLIENYGEIF